MLVFHTITGLIVTFKKDDGTTFSVDFAKVQLDWTELDTSKLSYVSFKWQEYTVATILQRDAINANYNDLVHVTDENASFTWNGDNWLQVKGVKLQSEVLLPVWEATKVYALTDIVMDNGIIYQSTTNFNLNNALTSSSWQVKTPSELFYPLAETNTSSNKHGTERIYLPSTVNPTVVVDGVSGLVKVYHSDKTIATLDLTTGIETFIDETCALYYTRGHCWNGTEMVSRSINNIASVLSGTTILTAGSAIKFIGVTPDLQYYWVLDDIAPMTLKYFLISDNSEVASMAKEVSEEIRTLFNNVPDSSIIMSSDGNSLIKLVREPYTAYQEVVYVDITSATVDTIVKRDVLQTTVAVSTYTNLFYKDGDLWVSTTGTPETSTVSHRVVMKVAPKAINTPKTVLDINETYTDFFNGLGIGTINHIIQLSTSIIVSDDTTLYKIDTSDMTNPTILASVPATIVSMTLSGVSLYTVNGIDQIVSKYDQNLTFLESYDLSSTYTQPIIGIVMFIAINKLAIIPASANYVMLHPSLLSSTTAPIKVQCDHPIVGNVHGYSPKHMQFIADCDVNGVVETTVIASPVEIFGDSTTAYPFLYSYPFKGDTSTIGINYNTSTVNMVAVMVSTLLVGEVRPYRGSITTVRNDQSALCIAGDMDEDGVIDPTFTPYDGGSASLELIGDELVIIERDTIYTDEGATATDNDGTDITPLINTINNVDTSVSGQYTVDYSVEYTDGTRATLAREVRVTETISVSSIDILDDGYSTLSTYLFEANGKDECRRVDLNVTNQDWDLTNKKSGTTSLKVTPSVSNNTNPLLIEPIAPVDLNQKLSKKIGAISIWARANPIISMPSGLQRTLFDCATHTFAIDNDGNYVIKGNMLVTVDGNAVIHGLPSPFADGEFHLVNMNFNPNMYLGEVTIGTMSPLRTSVDPKFWAESRWDGNIDLVSVFNKIVAIWQITNMISNFYDSTVTHINDERMGAVEDWGTVLATDYTAIGWNISDDTAVFDPTTADSQKLLTTELLQETTLLDITFVKVNTYDRVIGITFDVPRYVSSFQLVTSINSLEGGLVSTNKYFGNWAIIGVKIDNTEDVIMDARPMYSDDVMFTQITNTKYASIQLRGEGTYGDLNVIGENNSALMEYIRKIAVVTGV